jgi:hypothetical protein
MGEENGSIQFQLGQMTAQLSAMAGAMDTMSTTVGKLEERLRKNETSTTMLMVKMGMISVVAGGAGSFLLTIALKLF